MSRILCADIPPAVVWYDADDPLRFAEDAQPSLPPRENPRPPPGHPLAGSVSSRPDAYLDLTEVRALVDATLQFLGARLGGSASLSVKWSRAVERRGFVKHTAPPGARRTFEMQLSRIAFENFPLDERVRVVIHETCHVADTLLDPAGCGSGHGAAWRRLMVACGLPPDEFDKSHRGVDIHVVCDCSRADGIPFSMAEGLRLGRCHLICSGCGAILSGEHLEVPKHHARRLPPPGASPAFFGYICDCGAREVFSPSQQEKIVQKGDMCRRCYAPIEPRRFQQVRIGYCLVAEFTTDERRLETLGAVFLSTADLRRAAEHLPVGTYYQVAVFLMPDNVTVMSALPQQKPLPISVR